MRKLFSFVCVLFGIGLFLYPSVMTEKLSRETDEYIEAFNDKWGITETGTDSSGSTLEPYESEEESEEDDNSAYYEAVKAYNKSIYKDGQSGFCDAWSYQQIPIELEGFETGEFGYIEIPAMDVKLALYIGATTSNLAKGAAILGQTSIPIGGKNTNSVIAGHRGYSGIPYFREIEKLEIGDKIYITNPWGTLTYQVESIAVIDPDDSDAVRIQKGKDMVTLITCHPYRSHGKYRYVVYCVRSEDTEEVVQKEGTGTEDTTVQELDGITFESSTTDIRFERIFRMICGIIIIVACLSSLFGRRKPERRSRFGKSRKRDFY